MQLCITPVKEKHREKSTTSLPTPSPHFHSQEKKSSLSTCRLSRIKSRKKLLYYHICNIAQERRDEEGGREKEA